MKLHAFWIAAIAVCLGACGKQEPAPAPEPELDTATAEAPVPEPTQADEEFIEHMHAHAEFLDDLMFALADDDVDAAMTPAYWLARHETVSNIPDDWQKYVVGMREAALAVESAPDLETARARAEEITAQCQGCHAAAGVATDAMDSAGD